MTVISNAERDRRPKRRKANKARPTLLSIVLEEDVVVKSLQSENQLYLQIEKVEYSMALAPCY